jgi:hypothetical protein
MIALRRAPEQLPAKTGGNAQIGQTAKWLPITLTLAIPSILTVIPALTIG